jgi:hypothetical protein
LNVLDHSPLIVNFLQGVGLDVTFIVNGIEYVQNYLLIAGIYPHWSILCKPFTKPQGEKISHFVVTHESCRKDANHIFGVMQAHFHIIANPYWLWDQEIISEIFMASMLFHNMILEDEHNEDLKIFEPSKDIQTRCRLSSTNLSKVHNT